MLVECLKFAIIGYVFTTVLMAQDQLFGFWFRFLDVINRSYHWGWLVAKPLGWCERCFTGQLSMWAYFYLYGFNLGVVTFVCVTLFILVIIQKIL